jgi:hypothetical protein
MNLDEAREYLKRMTQSMEDAAQNVDNVATLTQEAMYELLNEELAKFNTEEGRFVSSQPLARRMLAIERLMYATLEDKYLTYIPDYLDVYNLVDADNKFLQKELNNIDLVASDIANVRQTVYKQAERYLTTAVADAYVQPAKYMMMQVIANGYTIKQGESMLKNWNDGDLASGKLTSGRPTPRLQAYAGQIARDSLFQYNGVVQGNIADKYDLKNFIYVGGLVEDSRPFCRHLVSLRRKINIDEVPQLLEQFPQGTISNTTKYNFPQYRGGYNCLHNVCMVR